MESYRYVNIFETKGLEYLLLIAVPGPLRRSGALSLGSRPQ